MGKLLYDITFISAIQQSETVMHIHISRFPPWLSHKESAYNVGDSGLIPGSGRSAVGGQGYPLQCSCLVNPMDRGAW